MLILLRDISTIKILHITSQTKWPQSPSVRTERVHQPLSHKATEEKAIESGRNSMQI